MHLGNLRVEDDTPGGGSYLGFAPLQKGAARCERSSSWIRVTQVFSVSFVAGFALHKTVCGGVIEVEATFIFIFTFFGAPPSRIWYFEL